MAHGVFTLWLRKKGQLWLHGKQYFHFRVNQAFMESCWRQGRISTAWPLWCPSGAPLKLWHREHCQVPTHSYTDLLSSDRRFHISQRAKVGGSEKCYTVFLLYSEIQQLKLQFMKGNSGVWTSISSIDIVLFVVFIALNTKSKHNHIMNLLIACRF